MHAKPSHSYIYSYITVTTSKIKQTCTQQAATYEISLNVNKHTVTLTFKFINEECAFYANTGAITNIFPDKNLIFFMFKYSHALLTDTEFQFLHSIVTKSDVSCQA